MRKNYAAPALQKLDIAPLSEVDRSAAQCAACHKRIAMLGLGCRAVWIGRPHLYAPAVAVCLHCLRAAIAALEEN